MTINGDKTKGTAKIANGWGGDVVITPEKMQVSVNNKGFSVTYKNVPQEACSAMASKLSGSTMVHDVSLSGTNNIGAVTAEPARRMILASTAAMDILPSPCRPRCWAVPCRRATGCIALK